MHLPSGIAAAGSAGLAFDYADLVSARDVSGVDLVFDAPVREIERDRGR